MKVLYFGIYNPVYPRNRLFIKGLRENGVEVLECNSRARGFFKYLILIWRHFFLKDRYDIMLVGFPGQPVMAWARKLTKKPIVFDTFLSLYDAEVWDRKNVLPDSAAARRLFIRDQKASALADRVLVDTKTHLEYFARQFDLLPEKFRQIYVGTDDEIFSPRPKVSSEFIVHVHGKYIPLQGIEFVVGAAQLLWDQPMKFRIVGRGQEYPKIFSLVQGCQLKNIELVDSVPYEKLPEYINDADVCLGIFGASEKTLRVIPNKVVEYMACAKAIITADSPAAREILTDGVTARFCGTADAEDLASKIQELYKNPELRQNLGENARRFYLANLTPKILGGQLKSILYELV